MLATAMQLVSQSQVDSARNKMIFWIIFTIAMLGLLIFKIVRATSKKNEPPDDDTPDS